jgi:hypothetical protein
VPAAVTNVEHTPRGIIAKPRAFGCYKLKCKRAVVPAIVHVDGSGSAIVLIAPDVREDIWPRQQAIGKADEELEQLQLASDRSRVVV